MSAFTYHRPSSLDEAASLLSSGARALAGGMTLLPSIKQRLDRPESLVDLSGLSNLVGVSASGGGLEVGAMTRHSQVANSKEVQESIPALAKLAGGIGDPQVRHRGTIGGSIANHDPAADYPAALLALGATVHTNRREIAAGDFFTGLFSTALDDGELVVRVSFPVPEKAAYVKFHQPASLYALVGVFVAKTSSGARVAVTGAGADGVFLQEDLGRALDGDFSAGALGGAKVPADGLMGDLHGTPEYRAHLISTLTARAVAAC